jgi:hypothetical protein
LQLVILRKIGVWLRLREKRGRWFFYEIYRQNRIFGSMQARKRRAGVTNAPDAPRNNTKTPLTWETIQQKIWTATIRKRSRTEIAVNIFSAIALMIVGHLLFTFFTYDRLTVLWNDLELNENFFYYVLGGFVAQMIDGALGMAYGVTASTFLLTLGVPPSAVSASVHTSEIFTSGVSGYMHLKFGNVNSKLFKKILFPGVLGAIAGAYLLSSFEQYIYIIKPLVAVYTLILGILIIQKALKKRVEKRPMTKIGWLALAGGTLDSIGGGGWGPIVTSTLIARGRHPNTPSARLIWPNFSFRWQARLHSSASSAFHTGRWF